MVKIIERVDYWLPERKRMPGGQAAVAGKSTTGTLVNGYSVSWDVVVTRGLQNTHGHKLTQVTSQRAVSTSFPGCEIV